MKHLQLLFFIFIVSHSQLFSQTDSVKSFKPYGLIDAAPFAINKNDFKPNVTITIHAVDAVTNLPLNTLFEYYIFDDSVVKVANGSVTSITAERNERIVIISNLKGFIWQSHIINIADSDTSYVLKIKKLKNKDEITKNYTDFNISDNQLKPYFYPELLGLNQFLKLNTSIKVEITGYPKEREKAFTQLLNNEVKKRLLFKTQKKQKKIKTNTITIKILST